MSTSSFNRSTSSFRGSQINDRFDRPRFCAKDKTSFCRAVEPDRLRQVEHEAIRRGCTTEALLEVSGRAVAQAVCREASLAPPPLRRSSKSPPLTGQPVANQAVIVVLAGNHINGAKAIAAVRHLLFRDYRFLLCAADLSNPASWSPAYKSQLQLLQSFARKSHVRIDSWLAISAQIKQLLSPPAAIIDALVDGHSYGMILDLPTAFETREMIDWMNRSRASVLSLTTPSGYDAETGRTTVVDGEPLAVKPDRVLACGAVVSGLLEALIEGEKWEVTVLDVGISAVLASDERVQFGSEWSVEVELAGGGE